MFGLFARVLEDEAAATAIEYGLIAASVAIAILVTVQGLGTTVTELFNSTLTALK
jgi:pilus assembly protein Flp/PilA